MTVAKHRSHRIPTAPDDPQDWWWMNGSVLSARACNWLPLPEPAIIETCIHYFIFTRLLWISSFYRSYSGWRLKTGILRVSGKEGSDGAKILNKRGHSSGYDRRFVSGALAVAVKLRIEYLLFHPRCFHSCYCVLYHHDCLILFFESLVPWYMRHLVSMQLVLLGP